MKISNARVYSAPPPAAESARRLNSSARSDARSIGEGNNQSNAASKGNARGKDVDKGAVDQQSFDANAKQSRDLKQQTSQSLPALHGEQASQLDKQQASPVKTPANAPDSHAVQPASNELAVLVAQFNSSLNASFNYAGTVNSPSATNDSVTHEGLVKEDSRTRHAEQAVAAYAANQEVEERNHFTSVLGIDVYA